MRDSEGYRDDWGKIKRLQTRILQQYIDLRMTTRHRNQRWVDDYQRLLDYETGPDGQHPGQYTPLKSKLNEIGLDSFALSNLDVTAASTLIQFKLGFFGVKSARGPVRNYAKCIQDDRNSMDAHSAYDESGFRVMTLSLVSLENLRRFVSHVEEEDESYSDAVASKDYCADSRRRILELMNGIEQRYETMEKSRIFDEGLKEDVISIRDSDDRYSAYVSIRERKYSLSQNKGIEGIARLVRFERAVADAGVDLPCASIGSHYFFGIDELSMARDYTLAAIYYSRAYYSEQLRKPSLHPEDELHFIDLMANGFVEGHDRDEAKCLLTDFSACFDRRFEIVPYEIDDMPFHALKRIPLTDAELAKQRKAVTDGKRIVKEVLANTGNMIAPSS